MDVDSLQSSELRSICPLVTLGLVLDSSGFPRKSKIFAGNAGEPTTFKEMVTTLAGSDKKPLIVMDAGIASEKKSYLDQGKWLSLFGVSRKRHKEWNEEQSHQVRKDGDNEVRVYSKRNEQNDEVDWEDEQLWRTYTMLTDLEAVFRSMKSELGMRPIYHQTTERVEV